MKILIVDDSKVTRMFIANALASSDITDVDQAADGQEAIDAVLESEYDLILMDWNMPNVSGIEAVREIRAQGKTMPIMMVTTENEEERVTVAVAAGAQSYIVKPFSAEQICERLNETIAKVGSGSE